ncbi:MAG: UDP-N-acetylmuramate dehydrogenase [Clostridiales bacterium]|nr:UDP-N-acetylmuramate dehydrogenase [Clostridiales bacterium]
MIFNKCYEDITLKLENIKWEKDFKVGAFTRYGTGGNCDLAIFPNDEEQLIRAISIVKGVCPYEIIGGGNNLLVSDNGYSGAVIITKNLQKTKLLGSLYVCESGVKLIDAIEELSLNSLSGLEFAVGIPATVGGAVSMNAGCFGKTVGDLVKYVVTENETVSLKDCGFGYRTSRFLQNKEAVVKVCFSLIPSETEIIEDKLKNYKRSRKNPKGRNCGSVFKNEGYFAGKVIDDCGLKGYKIGGAFISPEHANFIIAGGGATSKNIYDLINVVKDKVFEKRQIKLVEELVYLGEF